MKTKLTWRDGTPRSIGGPFDVLYEPKRYSVPPKALTRAEATAQRNREGATARSRRLSAMRKALKDNSSNPFCPPITTPKQSLRTQSIKGKM